MAATFTHASIAAATTKSTTTLSCFVKQINETFLVYGDFSNVLGNTETIVLGSSSVSAVDNAGSDATATILTAASLAVSSDSLTVPCKAGTAALSPYKITFTAVTSLGNTYIVHGLMYSE